MTVRSNFSQKSSHEIQLDMASLYLDTSAWIDMVELFINKRVKLLTTLTKELDEPKLGIFVSFINLLELIRPDGDASRFFSDKAKHFFYKTLLLSIQAPNTIVEAEINNYLMGVTDSISVLDNTPHSALRLFSHAFYKRKVNDRQWFIKQRKEFDEIVKRDKALDLSADIIEVTQQNPYASFKELHTDFLNIVHNPFSEVTKKKETLSREKSLRGSIKNNPLNIPSEEEQIIKYAPARIHRTLVKKYGMEKFDHFLTNPNSTFSEKEAILRDYQRMRNLTIEDMRVVMPGFYWESKIAYWNKYKTSQRRTGQLGDRNHAVYLPYVNYIATSDGVLLQAIETEYPIVFSYDKIKVFKIQ